MIKGLEDAYVTGRTEIIIKSGGKDVKFYANEIGYLASQNISVQAQVNGKNSLALLVAESITDEEGNKFSYDEIMRLKKEVAGPFFDAVAGIHKYTAEKKS